MPIENFSGDTWVAFSDLCGTKAMYAERPAKAAEALDRFYNTVYAVHEQRQGISCLAVSDCAIFWVHEDPVTALDRLLDVVKRLHQEMARAGYLVSTSIAWGAFKYQQRLELPHLRKDMVGGGAYLEAFGKNDRLIPGAVGIVTCPRDEWDDALCPVHRSMLSAGPRGFKKSMIWWVDDPAAANAAKQRQKEANESRFKALLNEYNHANGGPR